MTRYLSNKAVVVGLSLFVFGLLAIYASLQIPVSNQGGHGAQIFPLIGSISVALLGLLETLRGLKSGAQALHISDAPLSILGLLLLAIAYLWGISHFGYLIATAVAAPLALWLFGQRKLLGLMVAATLCPVIYHLIFFKLLGVFPPFGLWFDLLDVLPGA